MKKVLIVMGPPGCGKGTQASKLKEEFGLTHISTGDLFRFELSNETELGLKAKKFMDAGEFVPDSITIEMLRKRIQQDDCKEGFILDGFPRTQPQAEFLDTLLAEMSESITAVIYYDVSDSEVISRIKGRAAEDKVAGRSVRADDLDEEIIKKRLDVYHKATKPLLDFYDSRALLKTIDASKTIDEILVDTLEQLK